MQACFYDEFTICSTYILFGVSEVQKGKVSIHTIIFSLLTHYSLLGRKYICKVENFQCIRKDKKKKKKIKRQL